MDEVNIGGDVFDLVGLQMTYEMPLKRKILQLDVFALQFLSMTLAEEALTSSVSFPNDFRRVKLRHGYKAHSIRKLRCDAMDFFSNHFSSFL